MSAIPDGSATAPPRTIATELRRWSIGARPRTLPAAVVPVIVGTALGHWINSSTLSQLNTITQGAVSLTHPHGLPTGIIIWRAVAVLVVALGIQIGTNYANDFSDGVRGTDKDRVGPIRLVASGLATPDAVRLAALLSFGVAAIAGVALAGATTWWLLAVGAACFLAGVLYTGGPKPYGYLGLGEVFVFAFFGVVATMGAAYVQVGRVTAVSLVASLPVGFLSTALLEANNLRDIAGDTVTGKKTLAVRLGRARAGWLYIGALIGAALGIGSLAHWRPYALIALIALPLAVPPTRRVLDGEEGAKLLPVLAATGRIQMLVGVALTVGILL